MRVLSLIQPLATLHVAGFKLIETRSWGTDYRGRVAIAASKKFPPGQRQRCYLEPMAYQLASLGYNAPADLPTGAIVGYVDYEDCLEMVTGEAGPGQFSLRGFGGTERDYGIYEPERYAWISVARKRIDPIPYRGGLGLRHLNAQLAAMIESAPAAEPRW